MSRVLVMGDLHGAHLALQQCLERSEFDKENDTLIQLGDVVDGWPYVYECVEELLTIKNLISIKGNHDEWFDQWIKYGLHPEKWLYGGHATAESYVRHADRVVSLVNDFGAYKTNLTYIDIPESHRKFFNEQLLYFKDLDKNLFVHGGFNRHYLLSEQPSHLFYWDRDLWSSALATSPDMGFEGLSKSADAYAFRIKEPVKEIFIGHTSTTNWVEDNIPFDGGIHPITKPMHARNVWNLDTGAGFKGCLTIMDVETKEYWQSDPVKELYPDIRGRGDEINTKSGWER